MDGITLRSFIATSAPARADIEAVLLHLLPRPFPTGLAGTGGAGTGGCGQTEADAKGLMTWDVNVDSTVCRAQRHAAGEAKGGPPEGAARRGIAVEPADHGLARSCGGLTTKIHLAVEEGQKPLSIVVTAGQRGDSPRFEPVLEAIQVPRLGLGGPRKRPDRVRADKAYDSRSNRAYSPVRRPKAAAGEPTCCAA
ncbi:MULTISPECIES: transposase [unclassified Streptomyces]|uniref:transposase n=1 Tax=unclassified Streptomyces TaxID=2593676 RepID=UPI00341D01B3